ncbi:hypothetical protein EDB84DRAFT_809096 [Lactarius hengduanensis]|nr:hypothetical protein EDB84DRAFT_809096 [Lactarius hengduanensis]
MAQKVWQAAVQTWHRSRSSSTSSKRAVKTSIWRRVVVLLVPCQPVRGEIVVACHQPTNRENPSHWRGSQQSGVRAGASFPSSEATRNYPAPSTLWSPPSNYEQRCGHNCVLLVGTVGIQDTVPHHTTLQVLIVLSSPDLGFATLPRQPGHACGHILG